MGESVRGGTRRSRVSAVVLSLALLLVLVPAGADASVGPAEVDEYVKDFGVSAERARATLQTQARGVEAGIVGRLERLLGPRYAGIWFDNERAQFVVPLLGEGDGALVVSELKRAGLARSDYRFPEARSSWRELESAQDSVAVELADLAEDGLIQMSVEAESNAVAIKYSDVT